MEKLTIAIQKSGRLTDKTLNILSQCGLEFHIKKDVLFASCASYPAELMLVRDDDIPAYIANGTCDLGFVGENVLEEKVLKNNNYDLDIPIIKKMNYGKCRLSIAVPKEQYFESVKDLEGKVIATSYPNILNDFLKAQGVDAKATMINGAVEITPKLNVADAICDIVSTGGTLKANGLKEVAQIYQSECVLVESPKSICDEKRKMIDQLLQRLDGVLSAQNTKYVMMNASKASLDKIKEILPGAEEPSIMPLAQSSDKVAVHIVCKEEVFWKTIEQLKAAGASSILVLPIEKYIQ
ncbi:MAG: ATP phosphoribosyltransferase [Bdellovibrionales bacterium]|nr:ATP phosphoribosyltransferase [Bdellovibrionales bacterium]